MAGHPVYVYASDSAAGDTKGQGVGGFWFVVGGDGQLVKTAAPASASPSAAASPTSSGYSY